MKSIFDSVVLGGIQSRNRFLRSATLEGLGDPSGPFAAKLAPQYEGLARGGVGVIITGMVGVNGDALALGSMVKAFGDAFVPEFREVAARVHALGAKLVVQLGHCGAKAMPMDGRAPKAPSETSSPGGHTIPAMTQADIAQVVGDYAAAALASRQADADGVQIHGAHGYLLNQFLSPFSNKRNDEYGGSIANHARIIFEVYDAIRAKVGPDFPVWIKINSEDFAEDGMTLEESRWVCTELARRSIDAIELSGGFIGAESAGSPCPMIKSESDEGRFADAAIDLANGVDTDVISVCGYRTPAVIDAWLNKGKIAGISLSRPLISEPGLIKRWQDGDTAKARCISCNKCFRFPEPTSCPVFINKYDRGC